MVPESPYEATLLPFGKIRISCRDGEGEGGAGGDGTQTKTTTTETNDGGDGSSSTTTTESQSPDLQAQLDAEKQRNIQLQTQIDAGLEEAQNKLREGEDEQDRIANERDDYKKKYEKLKGLMETSYLTHAIATQYRPADAEGKGEKGIDFVDPEAVRVFLDNKKIRLDLDTGQIEGLDIELKRIAKEKSYLVRPKADPNNGQPYQPPGSPVGTGAHPTGGGAGKPLSKVDMARKYKIPGVVATSGSPV